MSIEYNKCYRNKYVIKQIDKSKPKDEFIPIYRKVGLEYIPMTCDKEMVRPNGDA